MHGGLPKLGLFWGVPIIRVVVVWGLCWGPLFWETSTYRYWGCMGIHRLQFALKLKLRNKWLKLSPGEHGSDEVLLRSRVRL